MIVHRQLVNIIYLHYKSMTTDDELHQILK